MLGHVRVKSPLLVTTINLRPRSFPRGLDLPPVETKEIYELQR